MQDVNSLNEMESNVELPESTQQQEQQPEPKKSNAARLYNTLLSNGFTVDNLGGDESTFVKNMQSKDNASRLFDNLLKNGFTQNNLGGSKDQFIQDMLEKKNEVVPSKPSDGKLPSQKPTKSAIGVFDVQPEVEYKVPFQTPLPKINHSKADVTKPKPQKTDYEFMKMAQESAIRDNTFVPKVDTRIKTGVASDKNAINIALDNATESALKAKGIVTQKFSAVYNQERQRLRDAIESGDAAVVSHIGKDESGNTTQVLGLKKTTGFFENIARAYNGSIKANEEADDFLNKMNDAQRVKFLDEKNKAVDDIQRGGYIGEQKTALGQVGNVIGENANFMGKAIAGATTGAALVAAAPETLGASLTGLPAVLSFAFTGQDAINQGAYGSWVSRYYKLLSGIPNPTEQQKLDALKRARAGEISGGILGGLENMALTASGLKPFSVTGRDGLQKVFSESLNSAVTLGTVGGARVLTQKGIDAAEGYHTTPKEVANEVAEAVANGATVGFGLHMLSSAASGIFKINKALKTTVTEELANQDPKDIQNVMDANVKLGNITPEVKDKVISDIDKQRAAGQKVADGLTPEAKASIAGLIQLKDKLTEEAKTKDVTQQGVYMQRIQSIDERIQKITETNQPLKYEYDDAGRPLEGEDDFIAVGDIVRTKNDIIGKIEKIEADKITISDPNDPSKVTEITKADINLEPYVKGKAGEEAIPTEISGYKVVEEAEPAPGGERVFKVIDENGDERFLTADGKELKMAKVPIKASEILNQYEKGTVIDTKDILNKSKSADNVVNKVLQLFENKFKSIKISGKRPIEGAAFYDTKTGEVDINKNSDHWNEVEPDSIANMMAHEYTHHLLEGAEGIKDIEADLNGIKEDLKNNRPQDMTEPEARIFDFMTAEKNSPQEIITYAVSNPEVRKFLIPYAEKINEISNKILGEDIITKEVKEGILPSEKKVLPLEPKEAEYARTEKEGAVGEVKINSEKVRYNGTDAIGSRKRPESEQIASRKAAKEKIKNPETNASLKAANSYNKSVGLPEVEGHKYKPSDPVQQTKIAKLYPELQDVNSPNYKETDLERRIYSEYKNKYPEIFEQYDIKDYKDLVHKAYKQLIKETELQYDALPVKITFHENGEGNYENNFEMLDDVHNFNHLWVYKGGADHTELGSKTMDKNGLTANDKFRAVHDYYGHSVEGYQFGKDGEENAWIEHSKMFSPLAQWALSSETRGQNSFDNYSGINDVVLETIKTGSALKKEGKRLGNQEMINEGEKLLSTVYDDFQFAEQKAIILPPEFSDVSQFHKTEISKVPEKLIDVAATKTVSAKTKPQQIAEGLLSHLGLPKEPVEKEVKFSKTAGEQKVEGTLGGKPVTFIKNPENLEVVNGFYSPIEKRLLETKADKLSANKWKEIVGKGDEAKFTGVLGWLESLPPTQQVSKSEIQNWMKDNRIEINEVVKEKVEPLKQSEIDVLKEKLQLLGTKKTEALLNKDKESVKLIEKEEKILFDKLNPLTKGDVKYESYQLPGEKTNYKEVLVTLPFKKSTKLPEGYTTERSTDGKYRVYDEEQSLIGEGKTEQEAIADALNEPETAEKPVFKSSHYDEPNILAHIRMNTRVDAEGNKVLHIEEFQSDWGQKGKKEGFDLTKEQVEDKYNKAVAEDERVENKINKKYGEDWWMRGEAKDILSKEDYAEYEKAVTERAKWGNYFGKEYKQGIPEAPFVTKTQDWTKLAWKVALKEAVKEGADKITWTTGEQQNARYDLSKQVDEIKYKPLENGQYEVSVIKNGSTLQKQVMKESELESNFGKDVAKRINNREGDFGGSMAQPVYSLKGENLSVGGTGMKGFYGSPIEGKLGIVGEVAKSLFKQEPKTTELKTSEFSAGYRKIKDTEGIKESSKKGYRFVYDDKDISKQKAYEIIEGGGEIKAFLPDITSSQHSIDITPEMRGQVEAGMPKFSKRKIQESTETLTSKSDKEKQVIDQMNSMDLVNKGIDLSSPSTTKEKIDVNELNSRLDNPLNTVKWEDFEGVPFTFTISDQLRTGDVKNPNTGEVITDLKGGIGFNGTKGNENNAWANTSKVEAEAMLQRAKDVYENNKPLFEKLWEEGKLPDGHIPMAVVKMAETSIVSNEAVFRTGIQNIETLPKSNRKRAVSELVKSMKAKINTESQSLKRGVDKNGKPYTENTIKLKNKTLAQYQKILDIVRKYKYDDIVNVLKDKEHFSLPEKTLIANEVFYGSPTPIGGKEIDISRSRPNTPVSKVLIGDKNPALINVGKITDLLTEPSMKNVPNMHIISIVGIDVKNPEVKDINHKNYPYGVKGKSIGVLESPVHMKDAFGEAHGSALSQVVKNEAEGASINVKNALMQGIPVQSGLPNRVFKPAIAKGKLDAVDKLSGFLRQAFPGTTFFTSKEAWDAAMSDPSIKKKLKNGDVVYAFTTDGNVFINPELKTTKATLHETGHIWMSFVKENNPEIHRKGLDLVSGTKEHERAKEEYGDTELAREEALMELMSTKGDTIVNAAQKAKFKEWLLTLYKYVADTFKSLRGLTPKEIENVTLDEFLNGMLADILSGKELTSKKVKGGLKFSLESQYSRILDYINSQRKAGESDADIRSGIESVADKLGISAEQIDSLMKGEPEKKEVEIYVEDPRTILSMRGLQEIATQWGLDDVTSRERKSDLQLLKDADNTVKDWIENKTYKSNIKKIVDTADSAIPLTDEQRVILEQHIATVRKEAADIKNEKGIDSQEFNDKLKELSKLVNAGQKTRSAAGAALRIPTILSRPLSSVETAMVAKMDALGVDELTPSQKESVIKMQQQYETKLADMNAKFQEAQRIASEMQAKEAVREEAAKAKKEAGKGPKKDYKKERESLLNQLKDEFKNYIESTKKLGIVSDGGAEGIAITVKMAKIIAKIAKSHIEEVGDNLSEIVTRTLDEVKGVMPGITKEDIHNVIAGKYAEKKPTRNQLEAQWKSLQSEAKLLDEYYALLRGEEPKSEEKIIKKNQKLKELRDKIDEYKKQEGIGKYSEEEKIKRAEEAAQESVKELENKIRNNELEVVQAEKTNSPRLESLREKQKELRKELEAKRKEAGIGKYSEEARAKRLIAQNKERVAKIEERIANKDFDPKPKPKSFIENEEFKRNHPDLYNEALDSYMAVEDAQHEFDIELHNDNMKKRNLFEKSYEKIQKTVGTIKAIKTGIDDSAVGVQNLAALLVRPVVGSKAFRQHVIDAASQAKFDRWLTELHLSPDYKWMVKFGLDITEPKSLKAEKKEEIFNKRWSGTIKVRGKEYKLLEAPLKPFERAFTSLGNANRVIAWRTFVDKYYQEGYTYEKDPELFESLAKRLNTETGRGGEADWVKRINSIITLGIWSPKLMASKLNMLCVSDFVSLLSNKKLSKGYYMDLHPKERLEAAKDLAKFATAIVSLTYLMAYSFGGEVDDDPKSFKFLDVKMPDGKSYNLTGQFSGYIRAIFQFATGKTKTDEKVEDKSRFDILGRFLRGKVPPITGAAINVAEGKDYMGNPTSAVEEGKKLLIPISVGDISKQVERDGASSLFTQGLPTFFGLKVSDKRDFPRPEWESIVSKEEAKYLMNREIKVPSVGTIGQYKVGPENREMTEDEYNSFKSLVENYDKGLLKDIGTMKFRPGGKGMKVGIADLTNEELQQEINQIHEKSVELAKLELKLQPKKGREIEAVKTREQKAIERRIKRLEKRRD